ncbi:MAG TPA: hypothetical protein VGQ36_13970 [Thermoanaerobaculia bacterium]|jgi:hypothetical protein|nr:hypothetical protein [Thermoanaerobaculia bacterium]
MSDERARWRLAGGAVLALAVVALLAINIANLPESWLERWLDTKLPQGSSIVMVRTVIEKEQWRTVREWVGPETSLVLVLLGRGGLPRKYVYAYFTFDRFGRLINVDVQKHPTLIPSR